jgi:hypothetical protein
MYKMNHFGLPNLYLKSYISYFLLTKIVLRFLVDNSHCKRNTKKTPRKLTQEITILTSVGEMRVSIFGRNALWLDICLGFPQSLQANSGMSLNYASTASFYILSNLLFAAIPSFYAVTIGWAHEGIIKYTIKHTSVTQNTFSL